MVCAAGKPIVGPPVPPAPAAMPKIAPAVTHLHAGMAAVQHLLLLFADAMLADPATACSWQAECGGPSATSAGRHARDCTSCHPLAFGDGSGEASASALCRRNAG